MPLLEVHSVRQMAEDGETNTERSRLIRQNLIAALSLAESAILKKHICAAIGALDADAFKPTPAGQNSPSGFYVIPGFPKYVVDKHGRIFGLVRKRYLRPWRNTIGHLRVDIRDHNGKQRKPYVHDLVLAALNGPKPNGVIVRHLNDDPTDNRLENLEYGTPSENTADAIGNGRNRSKFSETQLAHIFQLREGGCSVEDIMELYPCSMRTMTKILSGSLHLAHGNTKAV